MITDHPVHALIEARYSANFFDKQQTLSKDIIHRLIEHATYAPSAYNLQNWYFIVAQSPEAKERLKKVAYGQQKVTDASVSIIICGRMKAHQQLSVALEPAVDSGLIPQSMVNQWVDMATQSHTGNLQLQRDEAIRSASLAAMNMMLSATGMGLASCAMSGFDAEALAKEFTLSEVDIPVMIVTIGYAAENNWRQKPRLPVEVVAHFI